MREREHRMLKLTHLLALVYQKLGRIDEAGSVWLALIENNAECYDHYRGYISLNGSDICKSCISRYKAEALMLSRYLEWGIARSGDRILERVCYKISECFGAQEIASESCLWYVRLIRTIRFST